METAIVGLFAAILGGLIHAFAQQRHSKLGAVRQQKIETYASYYKGISLLSHAKTPEEKTSGNMLVAEARGKIALYGSAEVVEAMVVAFRKGPISQDDLEVHASVIRAMRKDVGIESSLPSEVALFEMLFGSTLDRK